jgi:transposase
MTHQHAQVDTPGGVEVTGGVDTHKDTHVAAGKDGLGRVLGTRAFPATSAGFAALLTWLAGFGPVVAVGVEGTGSYGAGLARYLTKQGITVVEVNRPDRATRRQKGKSDPQDAINAAAAVQSGHATATPKTGTGVVEAIRALRTTRASAIKSRTIARNQLHNLIITAPTPLRESLTSTTGTHTAPTHTVLITRCSRLRPGTDLTTPLAATKTALRRLAHRIQTLTSEITDTDTELATLTQHAAPRTTALFGVGPDTAGQLLTTAGDNPDRITTEARFAHTTGVAPIPAHSGRTTKHRLNRGGDRHANAALHRIVIVRLRHHQPTRDYLARRTTQGLSKKDIIRCLKRYVAREIYHTLRADLATT